MLPTRYLVLFNEAGRGWNSLGPFESLNPDLDGDLALQRARECADTTAKNYGCETVVVRLADVASAAIDALPLYPVS